MPEGSHTCDAMQTTSLLTFGLLLDYLLSLDTFIGHLFVRAGFAVLVSAGARSRTAGSIPATAFARGLILFSSLRSVC